MPNTPIIDYPVEIVAELDNIYEIYQNWLYQHRATHNRERRNAELFEQLQACRHRMRSTHDQSFNKIKQQVPFCRHLDAKTNTCLQTLHSVWLSLRQFRTIMWDYGDAILESSLVHPCHYTLKQLIESTEKDTSKALDVLDRGLSARRSNIFPPSAPKSNLRHTSLDPTATTATNKLQCGQPKARSTPRCKREKTVFGPTDSSGQHSIAFSTTTVEPSTSSPERVNGGRNCFKNDWRPGIRKYAFLKPRQRCGSCDWQPSHSKKSERSRSTKDGYKIADRCFHARFHYAEEGYRCFLCIDTIECPKEGRSFGWMAAHVAKCHTYAEVCSNECNWEGCGEREH